MLISVNGTFFEIPDRYTFLELSHCFSITVKIFKAWENLKHYQINRKQVYMILFKALMIM